MSGLSGSVTLGVHETGGGAGSSVEAFRAQVPARRPDVLALDFLARAVMEEALTALVKHENIEL